ncbi:hypothetical protein DFJ73DRAFT_816314 [Zopfochytrium polystomum]|nr:hypothetical protein DFJ73DRAFT_816314 [Zopfochytrium polystomum]
MRRAGRKVRREGAPDRTDNSHATLHNHPRTQHPAGPIRSRKTHEELPLISEDVAKREEARKKWLAELDQQRKEQLALRQKEKEDFKRDTSQEANVGIFGRSAANEPPRSRQPSALRELSHPDPRTAMDAVAPAAAPPRTSLITSKRQAAAPAAEDFGDFFWNKRGSGGGGAPLRDSNGNPVTSRRGVTAAENSESGRTSSSAFALSQPAGIDIRSAEPQRRSQDALHPGVPYHATQSEQRNASSAMLEATIHRASVNSGGALFPRIKSQFSESYDDEAQRRKTEEWREALKAQIEEKKRLKEMELKREQQSSAAGFGSSQEQARESQTFRPRLKSQFIEASVESERRQRQTEIWREELKQQIAQKQSKPNSHSLGNGSAFRGHLDEVVGQTSIGSVVLTQGNCPSPDRVTKVEPHPPPSNKSRESRIPRFKAKPQETNLERPPEIDDIPSLPKADAVRPTQSKPKPQKPADHSTEIARDDESPPNHASAPAIANLSPRKKLSKILNSVKLNPSTRDRKPVLREENRDNWNLNYQDLNPSRLSHQSVRSESVAKVRRATSLSNRGNAPKEPPKQPVEEKQLSLGQVLRRGAKAAAAAEKLRAAARSESTLSFYRNGGGVRDGHRSVVPPWGTFESNAPKVDLHKTLASPVLVPPWGTDGAADATADVRAGAVGRNRELGGEGGRVSAVPPWGTDDDVPARAVAKRRSRLQHSDLEVTRAGPSTGDVGYFGQDQTSNNHLRSSAIKELLSFGSLLEEEKKRVQSELAGP